MLSPRWCKVLRDLWINKKRTVLVVLSIAVGVFSVGVVTHMRMIVSRDLAASYVKGTAIQGKRAGHAGNRVLRRGVADRSRARIMRRERPVVDDPAASW